MFKFNSQIYNIHLLESCLQNITVTFFPKSQNFYIKWCVKWQDLNWLVRQMFDKNQSQRRKLYQIPEEYKGQNVILISARMTWLTFGTWFVE